MNNNGIYNQPCGEADEISLYDIWQKLVQHKQVFLGIFFIVLVIGSTFILFRPHKYEFSQIIELSHIASNDKESSAVITNKDLCTIRFLKFSYINN